MTVTFAGPLPDPSLSRLARLKGQTISHLVFTLAILDIWDIFDFTKNLRRGLWLEISTCMSVLMLQCNFIGDGCIFKHPYFNAHTRACLFFHIWCCHSGELTLHQIKNLFHLGSVWLERVEVSLEVRSLAVSHVLNTLRFLGSCCVVSIVTRWEVLRPCHYSHRRSTWLQAWLFGSLPCVDYFALAVDLYPFPFSVFLTEVLWWSCWSARRLRPPTFSQCCYHLHGGTLRPRANHRPFSQPPDANTLQTRVTEDNGALAHEKKT